mmetsp:Transcript_17238/g.21787  ORF Transcript_17238/g.21787 Transcript_17238/m.21787 type:complete len:460 (-) Transcript_17238:103-1482(-)
MLEMILIHSHRVQDLSINLLILNINQFHLLSDTLHRSLSTKSSNICTDKTMSLPGNILWVDIFIQLHVTGVDTEYLKTSVLIWYTNINFTIETSKSTKGRIHGVWAICGSNHNYRGTLLQSIHKGEHLGNNPPLHLSVGLFTLWCNGVNLIDKDNCRGILLCLLKGFTEVGFGFSRHFGHDFRSVDEEEEGTRLIGDSACNERLTRSRWSIEEHTPGWLDSQGFKEGRMTKWQFNHLPNLRHLLSTASYVIIAHIIQLLLILSLDRLSLAVNDSIRRHDAVWGGISLDHLKLDGVHGRPDNEQIPLLDRPVRLQKVWFEVNIKEVARNSLNRIIQGEDMDPLAIGHITAGSDGDHIGQTHPEVLTHHFVHFDRGVVAVVVGEDDADCVLALLAFDEDSVSAEELEFLHFGGGEGDDGIVVVVGVVYDEAVGGAFLAPEDGVFHFCVFAFTSHFRVELFV